MRIDKKKLTVCLAIPLAAGAVSALITNAGMDAFKALNRPPLTPAEWLFPVVWTILYVLMGIASYLAVISDEPRDAVKRAIVLYGIQLALNFLWPIVFFSLSMYLAAFILLVVLWLLILATAVLFYRLSHAAGLLLIPYLVWVAFAGYINLGVYMLN